MAGVELEKYATGHETSTQQSGKQSFPYTTKNWSAFGKLLATYNFANSLFCLHNLYLCSSFRRWQLETSCPQHIILHSRLCCRDLGTNGPNDKHSLEEQYWHLALATLTVAPLQVARLGWLPRQAKLPLHGGWRRTWQMCHWPWNAKSTVRKARSSHAQNQPGSSWENWWLPTTSQIHFFATHHLHLGPI